VLPDGWSVFDRLGNVAFVCDAAKIHRISRFVILAINVAARVAVAPRHRGGRRRASRWFEGTTEAYAKVMWKNADNGKGARPRLAGTTSDNGCGGGARLLRLGAPGFCGWDQTHTGECH
jgi:hypothetical protein